MAAGDAPTDDDRPRPSDERSRDSSWTRRGNVERRSGRRLSLRELPSDGFANVQRPQPPIPRPRATAWFLRFLKIACVLNLLGVAAIVAAVLLIGERWYLTTAALYLPRWPWGLPSIPLTLAAAWAWRRGLWLTLPAAAMVFGPLCGLRMTLPSFVSYAGDRVVLATANIQNGEPNLPAILGEVERRGVYMLCCQEVDSEQLELNETAARMGLDSVHYDSYFWTASRYPLRKVRVLESQASYRDIAAVYEMRDLPNRAADGPPLFLVNVHLSTARFGLKNLRPRTPLTGVGLDALAAHQAVRRTEVAELAALLDELDADGDVIACGDFNMPTDSTAFAPLLSGRRSAFDDAGFGYGYTVPNDAGHGWPRGLCWLRVDQVLVSESLVVHSAAAGNAAGSDHRAMFVDLTSPVTRTGSDR